MKTSRFFLFKITLLLNFVLVACNHVFSQNNSPTLNWGFGIGSKSDDHSSSVIDKLGNTIVSGVFADTIDVDPDTAVQRLLIPVAGKTDFFLAKYDTLGKLMWAEAFASKGYNYGFSVALDSYNNIFLAGVFSDSTDVDPSAAQNWLFTGSNLRDVFFAKYDANGNFNWAKSIHTQNNYLYNGCGLYIDKLNNLYVVGSCNDSVDFDPGLGVDFLFGDYYTTGPYIAKYDSNGDYIWARHLAELPRSFNIDANQNIILAGSFEVNTSYNIDTTIYFVDGTAIYYTMMGSNMWDGPNSYIAKLDSLGKYVWFNYFESGDNNEVNSVVLDNQNNILVLGYNYGSGDFIALHDTLHFTYQSVERSSYFLKISSNGDFLMAKSGVRNLYFMNSDSLFNLYLPVYLPEIIDVDPGPAYKLVGGGDIFHSCYLLKYDKDFNFIWVTGITRSMVSFFNFEHLPAIYLTSNYIGYPYLDPLHPTVPSGSAFGGYYDLAFAKYSLDSCSSFYACFDSLTPLSCATAGEIFAGAYMGAPPYNFVWNTTPLTSGSQITATQPTFLNLQVSDSKGCSASIDTKIEGPNQNTFDMSLYLTAQSFRPGIPSKISLDIWNDGCISQSGTVYLVLDSGIYYSSAYPTPSLLSGDTVFWSIPSINYNSPAFHIEMIATTMILIPGTPLDFMAYIIPINGENDTLNNRRFCHSQIRNSFDPNEKSVQPEGTGVFGKISPNQSLTYTIHFQNTGNDEAINVIVSDTLDADLNYASLTVVGSSHSLSNVYLVGNVVRFCFTNINLPDSFTDQLGSNGYIAFEIKQKANLPHGTSIENRANIYFDFNPAIITNTVLNTIDIPTSTNSLAKNKNKIKLYPNPANQSLAVDLTDFSANVSIQVNDCLGQIVEVPIHFSGKSAIMSLNSIKTGIYSVLIRDDVKGTLATQTFVKNQ